MTETEENRQMRMKLEEEKAYLQKMLDEQKSKTLELESPEMKMERIVGIPLEEYEQLIRENERMKTIIESAKIIHNLRREGDD